MNGAGCLQDYSAVIQAEHVVYAKVGHVEYSRRQDEGFRRVFPGKSLK